MRQLIDLFNIVSNHRYSDYTQSLENVVNGGESAIGLAIISQIIMRHRISVNHEESIAYVKFDHKGETYKFGHKFDHKKINTKYVAVIMAATDYFKIVNGKT